MVLNAWLPALLSFFNSRLCSSEALSRCPPRREPMGAAAGAVRQALLAAADAALLSLPDADGSTCGADSPEELGCPPWLRQAILARAQACIRGWHS